MRSIARIDKSIDKFVLAISYTNCPVNNEVPVYFRYKVL